MDDRITPRTTIRGFLDVASISKSAISTRSRVRRSSISSISNTVRVEAGKRKSQSFHEITPRTLIQSVLATNEVAPDTARKRPRTTPQPKKTQKALTPGTATRSASRRATRLDVLATPGGSNPTPRSLIQGLVKTAPVETPWNASSIRRRSSPRTRPDFPTVTETLQNQAPGPSLSPFIKDPKSVQRHGGRKLRTGLRRGAINKEAFAAGIAEKLSQEEAATKPKSKGSSVLESFREEDENEEDSSLSDAEEEADRQKDEERHKDEERQEHEERQEDEDQEEDEAPKEEEQELVGKDGLQTVAEEPVPDPIFVPVSVEDQEDEDDMASLPEADDVNQSRMSMRREPSNDDDAVEDQDDDMESEADGGVNQSRRSMRREPSNDDDFDEEEEAVEDQDDDMESMPETDGDVNQSRRSMRKEPSNEEEEVDMADQTTVLGAEEFSLDVSAGGDATTRGGTSAREDIGADEDVITEEDASTGNDASGETSTDDEALMPTQQAPSSLRKRGFSARKSLAMNTVYLGDGTTFMQQTMQDGYSPLATPKVVAGRGHKTPGPQKTPAPPRTGTPKSTPQAKKKPVAKKPSQRQQQKPELNTLPASLTKSIFSHFSKAKVSKDAMQAVMQGSHTFFKRISDDLMTYATHAHRHTIENADVELLMRRQRQITENESLHSLIEKYLPMEYRQELIPIARSGNKVTPKLGTI
ncbi:uncharacterized protein [Amphiura filiformis]|uniref:uncharacterized protein n=1 Tax=Amphiura filiformis TaxID=82378 RepID=UPI003B2155DF